MVGQITHRELLSFREYREVSIGIRQACAARCDRWKSACMGHARMASQGRPQCSPAHGRSCPERVCVCVIAWVPFHRGTQCYPLYTCTTALQLCGFAASISLTNSLTSSPHLGHTHVLACNRAPDTLTEHSLTCVRIDSREWTLRNSICCSSPIFIDAWSLRC